MSLPQSIFSIDVEDWFNLSGTGFEPPPSEWDRLESRIERNLHTLLELLAAAGGTATCFVVGYFAKRFPHLIREAVAAGHEIASHSYFHRLVYEMSADEFYQDVLATRKLLEDVSGQAGSRLSRAGILGHQANAVVLRETRRSGISLQLLGLPRAASNWRPCHRPSRAAPPGNASRRAHRISDYRGASARQADVLFRRWIFTAFSVPAHSRYGL